MNTEQFTIAVGNEVNVPIKFTLKEGKVNKVFSFSLDAVRREQDEIQAAMAENEYKFKEALLSLDCFTGWTGQRLILGPDGNAAEFSVSAFTAMLGIPAVAKVVYQAFVTEIGAKEKN